MEPTVFKGVDPRTAEGWRTPFQARARGRVLPALEDACRIRPREFLPAGVERFLGAASESSETSPGRWRDSHPRARVLAAWVRYAFRERFRLRRGSPHRRADAQRFLDC